MRYGSPCHVFYKYDGSNLRWEWNKKRGWYKFGTRTRLFDRSDEQFGSAIDLFLGTIADDIVTTVVSSFRVTDFIVFTEYFGPNSFAGTHHDADEKTLKLFDVNLYKKGIVPPREFVKAFGDKEYSAQFLGVHNLNSTLIESVKSNTELVEGVICKGVNDRGQLWMTKIKTDKYLDRLKNHYGNNWEKYE